MNDRDVAVVGLGCVFPDAPDLPTYWHNIVNGMKTFGEYVTRVP